MSDTKRKKPLNDYQNISRLEELLKREKREYGNYRTKYLINNASTYVEVNGEDVRWDSKTKANFNEKALKKKFLFEYYGTETPKEDLKYLKAKTSLKIDKSNTSLGEWWNRLGAKQLRDGGNTFDREEKKRFAKLDKELLTLKSKSSYGSGDIDVPGKVKKSESPLTLFLNTFESKQMINKAKEDVPLIETPYKLPWSSTQQKSINEINAAEKEVNNADSL